MRQGLVLKKFLIKKENNSDLILKREVFFKEFKKYMPVQGIKREVRF